MFIYDAVEVGMWVCDKVDGMMDVASFTHFSAHFLSVFILIFLLFTALHGMQTRSSDENSVCLSVRPSITRVNCDKTVERPVQIYIPYERTFIPLF